MLTSQFGYQWDKFLLPHKVLVLPTTNVLSTDTIIADLSLHYSNIRCATSWTVPGSIPGGVTGFFSYVSPSDRSMVLGSTQPLVKMSTRNIPGGKGGRCVRLTTSPPLRAACHEIWEPKPPGILWVTLGLLWDSFTFYYNNTLCKKFSGKTGRN